MVLGKKWTLKKTWLYFNLFIYTSLSFVKLKIYHLNTFHHYTIKNSILFYSLAYDHQAACEMHYFLPYFRQRSNFYIISKWLSLYLLNLIATLSIYVHKITKNFNRNFGENIVIQSVINCDGLPDRAIIPIIRLQMLSLELTPLLNTFYFFMNDLTY